MEEYEVFSLFCKEVLHKEEILDPLEYICLRDSLMFQRYLLRHRIAELGDLLIKSIENVGRFFEKLFYTIKHM